MRTKAIVLVATAAVGAFLAHGEALPDDHMLRENTVYEVDQDLEITSDSSCRSGLILRSGTAYINMRNGAKLTVKGADASGASGAGAGIEIGKDATLFITGNGEVIATGGNAAGGKAGGIGNNAEYRDGDKDLPPCAICGGKHSYWGVLRAGAGGDGGNGGGGAGAGIGGCGGDGGAGGIGVNQTNLTWRGRTHENVSYLQNGTNGVNGASGIVGGEMGRLVVTGMARVRVRGGSGGADATSYGGNGNFYASSNDGDGSTRNLYTAVGGGGGGGGAGGGAAAGVGGGGGGGGGGGSGGSGGYFEFNSWENVAGYTGTKSPLEMRSAATPPFISGRGGCGGAGEKGAVCGKVEYTKYDTQGLHKNGDGGAGGYSAGAGGAGAVYVTLRAGLEDQTAWRYAPPPPSGAFSNLRKQVKVSFFDRGKPYMELSDKSFMGELPNVATWGIPTRVGYRFAGWWTSEDEGSVCFYDRNNKPLLPYLDQLDEIRLEARWEVDPSALVVTSNGDYADGADRGDDNGVTLRDAVKTLCDNPSLTGTNGARRIAFALPEDKRTVTLARPIIVPAGTEPFEIFGLCGDRAVTIDGGGKTRLFDLRGDGVAVTFSHLMFTGASPSELGGGAIRCDNSSIDVADCAFFGNFASEGAAVYAKSGLVLLRNCTFAGNVASFRYGAVSASGLAVVLNCTFSENVASGSGSSAAALGLAGDGLVAHCTFARNGKSLAVVNLPGMDAAVTAVNCIFADGGEAVYAKGDKTIRMLYSGVTVPSAAFAGGGLPMTNDTEDVTFYGIRHVWYEPRQSDANFDAALIYYDGYSAGSAIAVKGVETNVLFGTAADATIPILADQLRCARLAPVRGAIRVISGEDRPCVTLEGRYAADKPEKLTVQATVTYDDPEGSPDRTVTGDISVTPDADGYFSARIPVDGSDGTAHNAVSCRIEGLNVAGDRPMTIATLPYAFTASSASALMTDDQDGEDTDLVLPGDAVTVNRAVADSVTVGGEDGWLEIGSQSFSAGTVRGFGRIQLEGVDVTEGRLDVLQDRNDEGKSGALPYGNLAAMTAGGGDALPFDNGTACVRGNASVAAKTTKTLDFGRSAAKGDGFVQVFVRLPAKSGNKVGLKVGSVEVTPLGTFGSDGRERRFLWTVPVRKGDVTELTLVAGGEAMPVTYQRQYMYFGVLSASELDDEEK